MIFETPRLRYRNLKKSDTADFFDMQGNKRVMELIPLKPLTEKQSNDKLEQWIKKGIRIWAVEEKTLGAFIGVAGFIEKEKHPPEILYRLREKFWRRGYGSEIAAGLVQYGFETLNFPKIIAEVNVNNPYSEKILIKNLCFGKEFFRKSEECTIRSYSITKEQWKIKEQYQS